MKRFLCFLILTLAPQTLPEAEGARWVIWNVGQGSWSTFIDRHGCWHIDAGGSDFSQLEKIRAQCAKKKNRLYLTHTDLDHINGIPRAQWALKNWCLATPVSSFVRGRKAHWLRSLSPCAPQTQELVTEIYAGDPQKRNHGRVFVVDRKILVTGDAPASLEKLFAHRLRPWPILFLLTGHHGSRTSTSVHLLKNLKQVRLAIASARKSKYGHPHPQTRARLIKAHIPLLTTEEAGTIIVHLE